MLMPRSEAEVRDVVAAAIADAAPLAVEGGGTRRGLGRPVQAARTLSLAGLTGITLHEPAEMVAGAWAGTPLAEFEAVLATKGQRLAFEPMDHRALLGTEGTPTLGAVAAGNISGPRRVAAGACRDSLLGIRFVNGRGAIIRSGGRVMKNVTGLDLVKLHAGAFGTLGVLTEVIVKVQPIPPQTMTLALHGLDEPTALRALAAALASPFEPTGAAHLPAGLGGAAASRTLLRIEGFPEQIAYRSRALAERLAAHGPLEPIGPGAELWAAVRDASLLSEPRDEAVWRLHLPVDRAAAAVAAVRRARPVRVFYDWGGGLVWLATPETEGAGAAVIREAATAAGGHATLVRGSAALRAAIPVFTPETPALARLTEGLKRRLDPAGVFNPGRMHAGH